MCKNEFLQKNDINIVRKYLYIMFGNITSKNAKIILETLAKMKFFSNFVLFQNYISYSGSFEFLYKY